MLIEPTASGLYCEAGGFHIRPGSVAEVRCESPTRSPVRRGMIWLRAGRGDWWKWKIKPFTMDADTLDNLRRMLT